MAEKKKQPQQILRHRTSKKNAARPTASRKTLSAAKIHRLQARLEHQAAKLQEANKRLQIEIAERKKAERILQENEEIFDRFLENSPIYVFFKDEHIRPIKLSRNYETMVGKPMAELLGKNMDELFPSELAKSMVADDRRILNEGKEIVVNEELNGRFYTTLKFPISIKGKPRFLAGYTIDITERKQAEEALRESEQKFRTLADSGRALIWAAGTNKLCNYFNRVWLEFTGRTIEQEMGNGWAEGVHTEDLERCLNIYTEAFDRREAFSMEYRLRRYDGAFRWILDDGSPQYNSRGEFIGYMGHCLDVTNRKEAEESLRKSSEMVQLLLNSTAEAIYGLDMNGNCTFINAACLKILGYEQPAQLLGRNMHDLIHSKHADGTSYDVYECPIFKAFKTGEERHVDGEVFWRNDGTSFSAEYWSYPVRQKGKVIGAVVTFMDISDRRKAELALRKTTLERERLIKELQHALDNVKTLQGLIPICANCKKVRDDKGYWNQVEGYISQHTDATFTHGICPDCAKNLYGDAFERMQKK